MPSKPFLAPRVWNRPRCAIYGDNYRFSDNLINNGLDAIQKSYHEKMARTEFKSASRAHDLLLEANMPLSHSISSSSSALLPPTHDSPLRRSMSVSRPSRVHIPTVDPSTYETGSSLLRRRSTRRSRPESFVQFADDLSPASASVEAHSQIIYLDRCRELGTEVERLNSSLLDTETRIKQEAAQVKNKLNSEVQQLQFTLDEQQRTGDELRSALKRQSRQIQELQSNYESMQRNYELALDELQHIQRKALAICNEVDTMRSSLDRS